MIVKFCSWSYKFSAYSKTPKAPNFLLCIKLINFIFLIKDSNYPTEVTSKHIELLAKQADTFSVAGGQRALRHEASDDLSQGTKV